MIHTIGAYTFEIIEGIKVRQAQEMAKISKLFEEKKIDDFDMAVKTICIMLTSINGNPTNEDWIKDNLDPNEFAELTTVVMEKVNEFVKKKMNTNTNTKPSLQEENETSLPSGESL